VSAPSTECSRSSGSSRTSSRNERKSVRYRIGAAGALTGSSRRSAIPSITMSPAANRYMARQPSASPTTPDNVRESRTPNSRPLVTIPTARPRSSGAASVAA
jgi:hypothetical protein